MTEVTETVRKCRTCMYWSAEQHWRGPENEWQQNDCKCRSPVILPQLVMPGGSMHSPIGVWPRVSGSDWCGDWEEFRKSP